MKRDPLAVVDGRGARRGRRGHPWIYRDNVVEVRAAHGDAVRVVDRSGRAVCLAAYSARSKIALRRIGWGEEAPADADGAVDLLLRAARRRGPPPSGGCRRLVHADADALPGLTLDWYAGHLVAQATTPWADRLLRERGREIAARLGAASLLHRGDAPARALEGLPREVEALVPGTPEVLVAEEGGCERFVAPWTGHKTGLYLDQQENHRAAPSWLGGEVLDLFCGEGGFALPLAAGGARVLAIDRNAEGLERAARAAERAGLAGRVTFRCEEAFDALARLEAEGARFDAIVLDPPPFARRRGERAGGTRGYRDLHRRALRLLRPGGRLLTFCCSFHVSAERFEEAVRAGAEEAAAALEVAGRLEAASDHPVRLELPESRYLKGLHLVRRDGASAAGGG
ncbi:MAG: class I SAM-dependent rRNA methyltransferase [Acidobacteria bacterium]|nr:MAG: class I SAM-dependent rRNA methyltransferase [Acidobacteriota bacterium]